MRVLRFREPKPSVIRAGDASLNVSSGESADLPPGGPESGTRERQPYGEERTPSESPRSLLSGLWQPLVLSRSRRAHRKYEFCRFRHICNHWNGIINKNDPKSVETTHNHTNFNNQINQFPFNEIHSWYQDFGFKGPVPNDLQVPMLYETDIL